MLTKLFSPEDAVSRRRTASIASDAVHCAHRFLHGSWLAIDLKKI